jgi:hypothetical protein
MSVRCRNNYNREKTHQHDVLHGKVFGVDPDILRLVPLISRVHILSKLSRCDPQCGYHLLQARLYTHATLL